MTPYKKRQKDKQRKNFFRKWHRRVGFTITIFLFNLAITGILLNHSDDLDLHKQYITSDWLISLYGIKAPQQAICINESITNQTICQLGEFIFLNNNKLIQSSSRLIGLVKLDDLYYLATEQKILIYTTTFELVDILNNATQLPLPVSSIFLSNTALEQQKSSTIVIESNQTQWRFNQNELTWHPLTSPIKSLESLPKLSTSSLTTLQNTYLDHQITLLKFIQDLHSGRVLLLPGKLLTDLVGIIVLLLAISGFIAWQKRKTN